MAHELVSGNAGAHVTRCLPNAETVSSQPLILLSACYPVQLACDNTRAARVMVSCTTRPHGPCALSLPTRVLPPNPKHSLDRTCDSTRATRVMVSRMTGPPAPCALSLPTSSWSKKAIERTACSLDRASGAAQESIKACSTPAQP